MSLLNTIQLRLGMKHLSEAVNTLLTKQDQSSEVAGPIYPAGHYQPYLLYHHHMLPYYGYSPCPPPLAVISPTQGWCHHTFH